jgi:hypothetical protein
MSDYFERVERQLVRNVQAGAPRRAGFVFRPARLVPLVSVAVAVAVALVFLGVRGSRMPISTAGSPVELVYQAEPTPQVPVVTGAAVARAVAVMRVRLAQLGSTSAASVRATANHEIAVRLPAGADQTRAEQQVGITAQIYFYDWEANVLLPDGRTVATKLLAQDQTAVSISQGSGAPGAGSMSLYDAVKLASRQPASGGSSRLGNEYYVFGEGGSPACAAAARFYGVADAVAGRHCLLSGPNDTPFGPAQGLPPGVRMSDGQLFVIKQGTVVLQAVPGSFSNLPKPAAPNTQFYVLRDKVALTGNEITNPHQSTDSAGDPDVDFGFTPHGGNAFHALTAAIARRGNEVSIGATQLQQHFAIALDGLLIAVPPIDSTVYPDGIPRDQGADITGGFTTRSAKALAAELRNGALPIKLKLISVK